METTALEDGLLVKSLTWLVRRAGGGDLFILLLLGVVVSSTTQGLLLVVRDLEPSLLWAACWLGLLAGWLAARSHLRDKTSLLLAGLLGLALVAGQVARLGDEALRLALQLNRLTGQAVYWFPGAAPPQPGLFLSAAADLGEQSLVLLARLADWLRALILLQPVFDPIASSLVWGWLLWLLSVWSSWAAFRLRNPLAAIAPATALLAVVSAYTHQSAYLLLAPLTAALILLAYEGHVRREAVWERTGVDYSLDIRFDIGFAVGLATLGLVAAAAIAPGLNLHNLREFAQDLTQRWEQRSQPEAPPNRQRSGSDLGESLGLRRPVRTEKTSILKQQSSPGLPRQHLLGSGPELSQILVMDVRVIEQPVQPASGANPTHPRYYWRALTYDRYTGRGWASSASQFEQYAAGELVLPEQPVDFRPPPGTRVLRQEVERARPGSGGSESALLHADGTPLSANVRFESAWRVAPSQSVSAAEADQFGATTTAARYQVVSLLSQPSVAELRAAGANYPRWVLERYLALPPELPERVRNLARELTASGRTPYDRASAIEAYLRSNYPYTLDLPQPPPDRDLVDYFLFDLRKGYCDYYASAMVVLSRAAGLPARLATGYAQGRFDEERGVYVVSEAQAHSWPEVFFPGYGWVRFEPTAGLPPLERGPASSDTRQEQPSLQEVAGWMRPELQLGELLPWALVILASILLGMLLWTGSEALRLERARPDRALRRMYRQLHSRGAGLSPSLPPGHTPFEFLARLTAGLAALPGGGRLLRFLQPAAGEAQQVVLPYTRSLYGPIPVGKEQQRQAIRAWLRLRWRLIFAVFLKRRQR